jgi:hypothetical protein
VKNINVYQQQHYSISTYITRRTYLSWERARESEAERVMDSHRPTLNHWILALQNAQKRTENTNIHEMNCSSKWTLTRTGLF